MKATGRSRFSLDSKGNAHRRAPFDSFRTSIPLTRLYKARYCPSGERSARALREAVIGTQVYTGTASVDLHRIADGDSMHQCPASGFMHAFGDVKPSFHMGLVSDSQDAMVLIAHNEHGGIVPPRCPVQADNEDFR